MNLETRGIPNFSKYLVREDGVVIGMRHGRVMKSATDHKGYRRQPMKRDDGKVVCNYLHRLAARAFLPQPASPEHTDVDHVDGNPRNNAKTNLRWVTHRENVNLAMIKRGDWFAPYRKQHRPVEATGMGGSKKFLGIADAVRWLDAKRLIAGMPALPKGAAANIVRVCQERGKTVYGYSWRYL